MTVQTRPACGPGPVRHYFQSIPPRRGCTCDSCAHGRRRSVPAGGRGAARAAHRRYPSSSPLPRGRGVTALQQVPVRGGRAQEPHHRHRRRGHRAAYPTRRRRRAPARRGRVEAMAWPTVLRRSGPARRPGCACRSGDPRPTPSVAGRAQNNSWGRGARPSEQRGRGHRPAALGPQATGVTTTAPAPRSRACSSARLAARAQGRRVAACRPWQLPPSSGLERCGAGRRGSRTSYQPHPHRGADESIDRIAALDPRGQLSGALAWEPMCPGPWAPGCACGFAFRRPLLMTARAPLAPTGSGPNIVSAGYGLILPDRCTRPSGRAERGHRAGGGTSSTPR